MSAPPAPPGPSAGSPSPTPVFRPVMAAGGRLRRTLNNSSARGLGLFVLAVTGAWWWLDGGKQAVVADVRSTGATRASVAPGELPAKPTAVAAEAAVVPEATPRPAGVMQPVAARAPEPQGPPPSLVSRKGEVRAGRPPSSTVRQAAYAPAGAAGAADGGGGLTFKTPAVQGWEAIAVGDLERTLKPGTDIPCTLNGAIDGTHPGDFSCVIARDVYGWAYPPHLVLIHAGDTVRGTYRPLSAGEDRLLGMSAFVDVMFGDKALMVPLGSAPVEDSAGRTGMSGYTESKFWSRLGNAIITDIGSGAARLPAEAMRSSGSGLQVSTNTTESIVQDTLRANTVHPLFRKNEGDTIIIRITQPVHFGALQYEAAQ